MFTCIGWRKDGVQILLFSLISESNKSHRLYLLGDSLLILRLVLWQRTIMFRHMEALPWTSDALCRTFCAFSSKWSEIRELRRFEYTVYVNLRNYSKYMIYGIWYIRYSHYGGHVYLITSVIWNFEAFKNWKFYLQDIYFLMTWVRTCIL